MSKKNDIKTELRSIFESHRGTRFSLSELKEQLTEEFQESKHEIKIALRELYNEEIIKTKHNDQTRLFYADTLPQGKKIAINILVLLVTILILFSVGEVAMRIKYRGSDVFATEYARMEYQLYQQLSNTSNPNRFIYGQSIRWGHDPDLGLVPQPGYQRDVPIEFDVNATHKARAVIRADNMNNQGMRQMHDVALEKKDGIYRIALLGDSFTLGDDVTTKFSFASELPELMSNVEVVNVGVSGKSIGYMYASYIDKAAKYNPDMVVMNVLADDIIRDKDGSPQFQQPYVYVAKNGSLAVSHDYIYSYEEFQDYYTPPAFKSYFLSHMVSKINSIGYKERLAKHNLDMFERIVTDLYNRTDGQFMVTLFLGWRPTLEHDPYKYELYENAKAILEKNKIPYFDGTAYLNQEITKYVTKYSPEAVVDVFYYGTPEKGHFTEMGYAVFANGLKDALKEYGFYDGKTIDPDKFIYNPDQQVLAYLDKDNQVIKYITSYDILGVVPKTN